MAGEKGNIMTRYYLSFHVGNGVYTRCFNSQEERETFRRRVDCKSARVEMWEA